ncbi:hypothetical protein ACVWZX_003926 [Deinococcus sp. UYEF24]
MHTSGRHVEGSIALLSPHEAPLPINDQIGSDRGSVVAGRAQAHGDEQR